MIDLEKALKIAKKAVRQSGNHLIKNFGSNYTLYNKNETNSGLFSRLDNESNDIILTILKKWSESYINEDTMILSEEMPLPVVIRFTDADIKIGNYSANLQTWSGYCWVVDPICGSIAYARGIRDFIVSISLVKNHQVLLAVVFDPCHNELFYAVLGQGAYLNEIKIYPSIINQLKESVISIEHKVFREVDPKVIKDLAFSVRRMRTAMTCALEMCYVACGRLDAVIKLDQAFYDYIGGALILSEAIPNKKSLIDLDNNTSVIPYTYLGSKQSFIGSNGLIADQLFQILKK